MSLPAPDYNSGRLTTMQRTTVLLLLYGLACVTTWWFAYLLRFDFAIEPPVMTQCVQLLPAVVLVKLVLLAAFGQFGTLLSYFGLPDVEKIFGAMLVAALGLYGARFLGDENLSVPRAIILSDFIVSFTFACGIRLALRMARERFQERGPKGAKVRRIGIVGAGDVGALLVKDLLARPFSGMKAVGFGDDNQQKWKTNIHGVQVIGSPEALVEQAAELGIEEVVIAMPSAPAKRIREIVSLLTENELKFEIVPSMEQLVNGRVRVSQLRPVELQDLLGREPVDLDTGKIEQMFRNRVVLVTGAGGSIGSELCMQIQSYAPTLLVLVERCEVQLFTIEQRLKENIAGARIVPMVADVLDEQRIRSILNRFKPEVVFHAAAHKHVPLMEHQPAEAIHNNAYGTARLADWALEYGVDRFVQISTDKAINPTNVMGATKRLAELYLQALSSTPGIKTKFMAVRFGNVLGSSGSVVPTFKRQIAEGGPLTVTHPDVTRYFMTVQEAVGLVLQSAAQGEGGEIFVLDMGRPMKIVDVARQLIELSGLKPDVDIEIKFTGLRPGEKLYEELNHVSENMAPTHMAKIMRFISQPRPMDEIRDQLFALHDRAGNLDADQIKLELQKIVPEYRPFVTV